MRAIVAWADPPAFRAPRATPRRSDIDDQPGDVEAYIEDTSLFQTQQDTE